jgi:predicted nucleic acid-binding protein
VLLVVDASVILQISLAGGSLGPLDGHDLIAPPLLASEVTSVLCEMTHRGELPHDQAREALGLMAGIPIRYERPAGLAERAWDLARSLGWARSYDAEYVALASMHEAALMTIDERLRRGAGHIVAMPTPAELATS